MSGVWLRKKVRHPWLGGLRRLMALGFRDAVAGNAGDREGRIGRQTVLDGIRLRQDQFVVGGLQPLVVEQRNLNRGLDIQPLPLQAMHARIDLLGLIGGPDESDVFLEGLAASTSQDPLVLARATSDEALFARAIARLKARLQRRGGR